MVTVYGRLHEAECPLAGEWETLRGYVLEIWFYLHLSTSLPSFMQPSLDPSPLISSPLILLLHSWWVLSVCWLLKMQSANESPARRAVASTAPWVVPNVPRAASSKGPLSSAAAAPEVRVSLPQVQREKHVQTCIFFYHLTHLLHYFFPIKYMNNKNDWLKKYMGLTCKYPPSSHCKEWRNIPLKVSGRSEGKVGLWGTLTIVSKTKGERLYFSLRSSEKMHYSTLYPFFLPHINEKHLWKSQCFDTGPVKGCDLIIRL